MKAEIVLTLDRYELNACIPYALICETREGARWTGRKLIERFEREFTSEERREIDTLFQQAHKWHLKTGVPETVSMTARTLALWLRLAEFCSTV